MGRSVCTVAVIVSLSVGIFVSLNGGTANQPTSIPVTIDNPHIEKEKLNQNTTTSIEKEIEKEDGFHSIEEYEKANKDSFNKVKEEAVKTSRKETAEKKISSLKEQSVKQYHEELLRQQGLKSNGGEITRTEKGAIEVSSKETKQLDKNGEETSK